MVSAPVSRWLGVAVTVGRARRGRFGGKYVCRSSQSCVFVDGRWAAVGSGGAVWWAVSVVVVDVDTDSAHRCHRMTLVES